jgi:lipopolysaccharide/colanic/teichoic acid biosynthesis glycosyltransferase
MNRTLRCAILLADLIWIVGASFLAHTLRFRILEISNGAIPPGRRFYVVSVSAALVVWIFLYFNKNLQGFSRGWHFPTICSHVIVGTFYLMASLLAIGFLTKADYSRVALLFLVLLLPPGFIAIRYLAWCLVRSWSRMGAIRRVVVVGSGRVARELANKIAGHPEMMIELAGFLYPADLGAENGSLFSKAAATAVRSLNIVDLLKEKNVKEIILTEQFTAGPEVQKLIGGCQRAGIHVHLVPQSYDLYLSKARLTEIDDVPLISVESCRISSGALELKRTIDVAFGALLLATTLPLMGVISIALKCGKRRAFKKELRCGRNGNQFWMYRFNIDRWAPDLVGFDKWVARISLTELPQLWNVIRGEMSLVGPRPESQERVKHYSVWQKQRLTVKPGLTGLAQVNGLREHHSSEEKARFDLQYIYHSSLFLDFALLLQTAWTLMIRLLGGSRRNPEPLFAQARGTPFMIQEVLHANSPQPGSH